MGYKKTHFIYIIRDLDKKSIYKIGLSKNPFKRLKSLQTSSSSLLEMYCCFAVGSKNTAQILENKLHNFLYQKRINGEWFALTEIDLNGVFFELVKASQIDKNTLQYLTKNRKTDSSKTKTADEILAQKAKKIFQEYNKASVSLLQRELSIGYVRASRIVGLLESEGFVSKARGYASRNLLK